MRKPLIVGNWKMNKTITEAINSAKTLKSAIHNVKNLEVLICPAFTSLYVVANILKCSNINIGSQNSFWESEGAFTGEISPIMLKDIGCSYVLVGHSERREIFGENNKIVNQKIKTALSAGLIPILCIGETFKERECGVTFNVIRKQINECLLGLTYEQSFLIVIAYEPVWAIGTGKTASFNQVQEIHYFIRKTYSEIYMDAAEKIRIIYGGSVNSNNISDFMKKYDIDGALVGKASLDIESFIKIIRYS
ncbi:MAG: triose-phosphate isomerase [Endomicrobium sp.]|jgi:triosephosphate isomerase|nr:triose-phosphate isomerase [Endomicrobium sp.]